MSYALELARNLQYPVDNKYNRLVFNDLKKGSGGFHQTLNLVVGHVTKFNSKGQIQALTTLRSVAMDFAPSVDLDKLLYNHNFPQSMADEEEFHILLAGISIMRKKALKKGTIYPL